MRSSILLAAVLVALPAVATAQQSTSDTDKPPPVHGTTSREKSPKSPSGPKGAAAKKSPAAKSPASRSPASPASKGGVQSGVNPADRLSMLRLRSTFRYAAEACTEGRSNCDRELLDNAEQNFLNACRACAAVDDCETERAAIREGKVTSASNLCVPR